MNRQELYEQIKRKRSFLCVGLDVDMRKIPEEIVKKAASPIFEFNRAIIDATAEFTVAYKPNLAFYEAYGAEGVAQFEATCAYIRARYPEIMIIADAKRGDIGNTSEMYARAFADFADAVTLSPYMGVDTVAPFLKMEGKWAVILALTSNPSADDFETRAMADGRPLWQHVLERASGWGTADNTMFVVGATRAEMLAEVRRIVPDHFLLVPGVGAQGGSLQEVARYGLNSQCGLLVNSSRAIIYSADPAQEAMRMAEEMAELL